ncbi:ACOT8 Acyl-coenzyme A thioesterase 8 [Candida maltosa Xu316]
MANLKDYNYKQGEVIDVQAEFGVKKISDTKYVGVKPLVKPAPYVKAGQALLVAMKSSPEGFTPHSLHSYFLLSGSEETPIEWDVTIISNGNSFCNRSIKAIQFGKVIYIANISLTKKNSYREAMQKHEEYYTNIQQKGKDGDVDDDDDDDDDVDERAPPKPFVFQTPYHEQFKKHDISKLPVSDMESTLLLYYKVTPEFMSRKDSKDEEKVNVADRRLNAFARWGIDNEGGYNQPLTNIDKPFQFVGLANISDGLFLGTLTRILRTEDLDMHKHKDTYVGLSLDHVLYFHDDDFDVTKWMGFSYKCTRFAHNRVVFEGEIYNDKGVQVASLVQEGLVKISDDLLKDAKL